MCERGPRPAWGGLVAGVPLSVAYALTEQGFAVLPAVLSLQDCDRVLQSLAVSQIGRVGSRDLLRRQWCRDLALALSVDPRIACLLPPNAVPVQCTLFEKSPDKNWLVVIHQDLSIPVAGRVDDAACTGWSVKDGITFVQPPADVLAQLLAVRLQLDEPEGEEGALRVIPGSHRSGRLSEEHEARNRASCGEVPCVVERGGVLVMRPLLLHASSKITGRNARRVLHFVFGPASLPMGLRWPEWAEGGDSARAFGAGSGGRAFR